MNKTIWHLRYYDFTGCLLITLPSHALLCPLNYAHCIELQNTSSTSVLFLLSYHKTMNILVHYLKSNYLFKTYTYAAIMLMQILQENYSYKEMLSVQYGIYILSLCRLTDACRRAGRRCRSLVWCGWQLSIFLPLNLTFHFTLPSAIHHPKWRRY